ncbi:substrate-binding periplasmic protein [Pseudomonas syringae]|uniref:substrate-binding periplasmic protein n=1 Tax=Pseudomonas syringae TaxID=317 RepID=UPI000F02A19B|nr:transporter substrate-binding domain-containing protein [Pseudomonas syringae]MCF5723117.1 transporter substrate-binding domain-containing protein [Pseudomonas syringae]
MAVRRWLLMLLCAVVPVLQANEAPVPNNVKLASEAWDNYTNADGSGLAWDLLREVFGPAGVTLQTRTEPYTRAIGLAQRGEVDGWVGSYRDEVQGMVYPQSRYDSDHIYALGLASTPAPTLDTLANYRLAWVRGYKFEAYLPNVTRFNQIERREGILPMLEHARADFYIDSLTEAKYVMNQAQDPSRFKLSPLIELPLYIGFADNERGRVLANLFDRRMETLIKNGQLKPIFERWHQLYPF